MAGTRLLPQTSALVKLVEDGYTHGEIAERYGVSRQAVTLRLKGEMEPRLWRRDWPWDVESRHRAGWLYEAISFYVAKQKKERRLSDRQASRVKSLLSSMEAVENRTGDRHVIDYDPDDPVGFYFRAARQGDPSDGIFAAA